ncbi:MAG: pilus assembly protein PilP [Bdellovibrionota bacterium]|jgi:Tfp pilus assembly protein PilP
MARRKKQSFLKKLLIIAGILLVAQIVFSLTLTKRNTSKTWKESAKNAIAANPELTAEQQPAVMIRLALLDYRNKNGSCPENLSKLVPEYLSSVPLDPTTKAPFQYVVNGKKCTLVLSKSKTDRDSKGSEDNVASETLSESDQAEMLDSLNKKDLASEYIYTSEGKKDPFRSYDFTPHRVIQNKDNPLESYTYDELKLTAVLGGIGQPTAIIENPEGKGFTVRVGTKIGNHGGEVVKIEPGKITIVESTVEFTGETKNRTIDMFLR